MMCLASNKSHEVNHFSLIFFMKILITSLAFYPDHSGIPIYSSDFAIYAAERGHEVKVVTGFPFYPDWKKRKEDKGVLFRKDHAKGLDIYRGYLYVPENPTTFSRILQELTFLIFAFINFFRAGKPDVIVAFTTPVSLGFLCAIFKQLYGCKLVINVQDFQVEAASSLEMSSGVLLKAIEKVEAYSYKKADYVSSISYSMLDILKIDKKLPEQKVLFWPNWIDVPEASQAPEEGKFRQKFDVPTDKKLIAYAGNVGEKQGLHTLIDLAAEYEEDDGLLFMIIGAGSDMNRLKAYAKDKQLTNIRFLPFLSPNEYKEFLADVNVVYISQKKTEKDVYFPSKLLGIMAMSKLILLSAHHDSELYRVLADNELALVSDFGNLQQNKKHMEFIKNHDFSQKNKFQTNSYKFVQQFDREHVLNNILNKIS